MKKWLRRLGWSLAGLVVLLVVAYNVVTSSWFLTSVALPIASKKTGIPLAAREVKLHPFSSLSVSGLTVGGSDHRLVEGLDLSTHYSLWTMALSKQPDLQDLSVNIKTATVSPEHLRWLAGLPLLAKKRELLLALADKNTAVTLDSLALTGKDIRLGTPIQLGLNTRLRHIRHQNFELETADLAIPGLQVELDTQKQPVSVLGKIMLTDVVAKVAGKTLAPLQLQADLDIGQRAGTYDIRQALFQARGDSIPPVSLSITGSAMPKPLAANLKLKTTPVPPQLLNLVASLGGDYDLGQSVLEGEVTIQVNNGNQAVAQAKGALRQFTLSSVSKSLTMTAPTDIAGTLDLDGDLAAKTLKRLALEVTAVDVNRREEVASLRGRLDGILALAPNAASPQGSLVFDTSLRPAFLNPFLAKSRTSFPWKATLAGQLRIQPVATGAKELAIQGTLKGNSLQLLQPAPAVSGQEFQIAGQLNAMCALAADGSTKITLTKMAGTVTNALEQPCASLALTGQVASASAKTQTEKSPKITFDLTASSDGLEASELLDLLPHQPKKETAGKDSSGIAAAEGPCRQGSLEAPAAIPGKPLDSTLQGVRCWMSAEPVATGLVVPFPKKEIGPVKGLEKVQGKLRLDLKHLVYKQVDIETLSLDLGLNQSQLTISNGRLNLAKGGGAFEFSAQAGLDQPEITYGLKLSGRDLRLSMLAEAFAPKLGLKGALPQLQVDLQGQGITEASLCANLKLSVVASDLTITALATVPTLERAGIKECSLTLEPKGKAIGLRGKLKEGTATLKDIQGVKSSIRKDATFAAELASPGLEAIQAKAEVVETTGAQDRWLGHFALTGSIPLQALAGPGPEQGFALELSGSDINALRLQQLLPKKPEPQAEAKPAKTVSLWCAPIPDPACLLAASEPAPKAKKPPYPAQEPKPVNLGPLHGQTKIRLTKLQYGEIPIQEVSLDLALADSVAKILPGSRIVLNGAPILLQGEANLKAVPIAYQAQVHLEKPLEVTPFARQFSPKVLKGTAWQAVGFVDSLELKVDGQGITQPNLKKSLHLTANIDAHDLKVSGLPYQQEVAEALQLPELANIGLERCHLPLAANQGKLNILDTAALQGYQVRIIPSGAIALDPDPGLDLAVSLGFGGSLAEKIKANPVLAAGFSRHLEEPLPGTQKTVKYLIMPELIPICGTLAAPQTDFHSLLAKVGTRQGLEKLTDALLKKKEGEKESDQDKEIRQAAGAASDLLGGLLGNKKAETPKEKAPEEPKKATEPSKEEPKKAADPTPKEKSDTEKAVEAGKQLLDLFGK